LTDLDFHDPATYAGGFPYDAFRELRDHDPVCHRDHPTWPSGYWALSRHADVQRVSRDSATFHNAPHPFLEQAGEDAAGTSLLLISLDG
jgi:cytochrome P450